MPSNNCQFLITDAGAPGLASRKTYDVAENVEVCDLTTHAMLKMKASEVSHYRHTLYVDGKPFRILSILK